MQKLLNDNSKKDNIAKNSNEKVPNNLNDKQDELNSFKEAVCKKIDYLDENLGKINNDLSSVIANNCTYNNHHSHCKCNGCSNTNLQNETSKLFKHHQENVNLFNTNDIKLKNIEEQNTETKNQLNEFKNQTNTKIDTNKEKIDEVELESNKKNKRVNDKVNSMVKESTKFVEKMTNKFEQFDTEISKVKINSTEEIIKINNVSSTLKTKVDELSQIEPKNNVLALKVNLLQDKLDTIDHSNMGNKISELEYDIGNYKKQRKESSTNKKKDSKLVEKENETKFKEMKKDFTKELNVVKEEMQGYNKKNENRCNSNEKKINETKQSLQNKLEQSDFESFNKKVLDLEEKTNIYSNKKMETTLKRNKIQLEDIQKNLKDSVSNIKKDFKDLETKNEKEIIEAKQTSIKQFQDISESYQELKNDCVTKENKKNVEINDLKKKTAENTNKINNFLNGKTNQNSNINSSPITKSGHKCKPNSNGCCNFCDEKFEELENKETTNYKKIVTLIEEIEELKLNISKLESQKDDKNTVDIISQLSTQIFELREKIIDNNVTTEDNFGPEDKNLKQEIKEIRQALTLFQESLNIMDKISYNDINNVKNLDDLFNRVDEQVTLSMYEETTAALQDKIEQIELNIITIANQQVPQETNQDEINETKRGPGRPPKKVIGLGEKVQGPLDSFLPKNNQSDTCPDHNYENLKKENEI